MASRRRDYQVPTSVLLGESISILFTNLPSFLLLALLVFAPYFGFVWFNPELRQALGVQEPTYGQYSWGEFAFDMLGNVVLPQLFQTLLAGMVVYGVVQRLRGSPAPLGQCVAQGFRAFPRLVLTALLSGLLVVIGFLLFFIPGVYLLCRFFVAVPAAVIEQTGPAQSLRRSAQLVRGSGWRIFWTLLVIGISNYILTALLLLPFVEVDGPPDSPVAFLMLGTVMTVLFSLWSATASGVAYARLRQHKEHADIDQLAAVFA